MNIHICSFASENFLRQQKLQAKSFLEIGFEAKFIHLHSPKILDESFYKRLNFADKKNKYGFYAFKPYFINQILNNIPKNDILIYMDVNDRPKYGLINYINHFFNKHPKKDILVTKTNYPNACHMSWSHKRNNSILINLLSKFICQPEAGFLAIRNNKKSISLLKVWHELTAMHSEDMMEKIDTESRHDQETLFNLGLFTNAIKTESWFLYKFFNIGVRKYIDWEFFRK
jgi:hypothetical protein